MTARITSAQQKQYKRFHEDAGDAALVEANPDKDGLQRLIERGDEYKAYIVAGIKRFSAKAPDYRLARTILGKDFISPEEIAATREFAFYNHELLAKFGDTLPSQEALKWCRDNGMMLVPGPPKAMSLLDVRAVVDISYFCSKGPKLNDPDWYDNDSQVFARNDKVEPAWIAICKEPVLGSLHLSWADQSNLVSAPATVPNAAEVAWGITTYKAVRGTNLLPNVYVRTSSVGLGDLSVSSDGAHVVVGCFDDEEGLVVNSYWDNDHFSILGVSAARKF